MSLRAPPFKHAAIWILCGWMAVGTVIWAEDLEAVVRDPFWPVGYTPPTPAEAAAATVDVPELEWPDLPVRGRSRAVDGSYLALIEGIGIVRAGQVVSVPSQGHWFHWRIIRIDAARVQVEELGITADPSPAPLLAGSTDKDKEKTDE